MLYRSADLTPPSTRRRERRAQSLANMHPRRIICPGSVLTQMTSSTRTWLINTPQLSVTLRTACGRQSQADTDTDTALALASSVPVQIPNHRRRQLGSGHYWTRFLVPSTYSTTVLLVSEHRHKRSPLTLTRAQRTFGCLHTAAIAMVINSMRPIVQRPARLIKISPLPMWVITHPTGSSEFDVSHPLFFAPPCFCLSLLLLLYMPWIIRIWTNDSPDEREPAESRAKL